LYRIVNSTKSGYSRFISGWLREKFKNQIKKNNDTSPTRAHTPLSVITEIGAPFKSGQIAKKIDIRLGWSTSPFGTN